MNAKVRIDLSEKIIELEGSEEFVSRYLDEFKTLFSGDLKDEWDMALQKAEDKEKPISKESKRSDRKRKATKSKSIPQDRFDCHGSESKVSLREFYEEKRPGRNNGNRIAVIAYYIKYKNSDEIFTEGNIDYAYKVLELKGRPKHLHQIIINNKNQRDFFEPTDNEGEWKITRTAEIFVEEKLPPPEK